MSSESQQTQPRMGLLASLRLILASTLATAHTRLAIVANELEEERIHLERRVVLMLLALFCFGLGIVMLTFLVVAVFWESQRLIVLTVCALSYFSLSIVLVLALRRQTRSKPPLFSTTLAELAKDRDQVRPE